MPYCVHCGVELDKRTRICPLCGTTVLDPSAEKEEKKEDPFFPVRKSEVSIPSKNYVAFLISALLLSVSLSCGILNIFFYRVHFWSFYIIGACIMLWLCFVVPLFQRKIHRFSRLFLDTVAAALYVFLIAFANNGLGWYFQLAVPIILLTALCIFIFMLTLRGRSILSTFSICIAVLGVYCFALEMFIDFFRIGVFSPSWSVIVLASCAAVVLPLIIIRRVPSLREEARRRFHF